MSYPSAAEIGFRGSIKVKAGSYTPTSDLVAACFILPVTDLTFSAFTPTTGHADWTSETFTAGNGFWTNATAFTIGVGEVAAVYEAERNDWIVA